MSKVQIDMGEVSGGSKTYDSIGTPSSSRIECGFQPRIIMLYDSAYYSSVKLALRYNADVSTTNFNYQYNGSPYTDPLGSGTHLNNVDSTGFDLPQYNYLSANAQIIAMEYRIKNRKGNRYGFN